MSVSRLVLASVLLSLVHGVARATPISYADISASATLYFNLGGSESDGEHLREHGTRNLGPVEASHAGASAWASITEVTDPVSQLRSVQLHAFAQSPGPVASGAVSATGAAMYFETLLLTSSTLPNGTPVEIAADLNPSWILTPTGSHCYGVASAGIDWISGLGSGRQFISKGTCPQRDENTSTGNIRGIIGQELTFVLFLQAGAGIGAPSTIDASHTLTLVLTPQGNFSYTAASGNAYVEIAPAADVAMPEPTTMVLLGTGLAFVARRGRQRGRSSQ